MITDGDKEAAGSKSQHYDVLEDDLHLSQDDGDVYDPLARSGGDGAEEPWQEGNLHDGPDTFPDDPLSGGGMTEVLKQLPNGGKVYRGGGGGGGATIIFRVRKRAEETSQDGRSTWQLGIHLV